jgi:hypothetical protein
VHGPDRGDHHAAQRRGRRGRREPEGEQQAAASLGGSGHYGVSTTRRQPERLEALGRSLEPTAAEPAEELLRAVAEEEEADRDARYQAEEADT